MALALVLACPGLSGGARAGEGPEPAAPPPPPPPPSTAAEPISPPLPIISFEDPALEAARRRAALRDETLAWLKDHPLTNLAAEADVWPKPDEACPSRNVRMISRPQLWLEPGVVDALKTSKVQPWSFVRFDVEANGLPLNIVAIDSSGAPVYDVATTKAVEHARFAFSNGVDLAKGCLAFFRDQSYVGVSPRLAAHGRARARRRPAVVARVAPTPTERAAPSLAVVGPASPTASPSPYGGLPGDPLASASKARPGQGSAAGVGAGGGPGATASSSGREAAGDPARGAPRTGRGDKAWTPNRAPAPGEQAACGTLADRLARPAWCQ